MITSEIRWHPNGGRLVVAMPESNTLIRCARATDTFVEVIKRIGIERVEGLGIKIASNPLISKSQDSDYTQRSVGEYYIAMGLNPEDMEKRLTEIAERLGISLYAELFPSGN